MAISKSSPRQCIIWIKVHCPLAADEGAGNGRPPFIEERATLEVGLVRLKMRRACLDQGLAVPWKCDLQSLSDPLCNFLLNRKHILHLTVVALRPQMISIRSRHQLRRDAQTVVSSSHTALKNGANLELFSDNAQVDIFTFERESRASRNNVQSLNLRQRVDDLLGDSVGEVLVLWVRAHVGERQYHDGIGYRLFQRRGCGRSG